jgi:Flp pilus assembly pilin Flp
MLKLYTWITNLIRSERGQDLVEYALVTVLISAAIIGIVAASGLVDAFGTWADTMATCILDPTGGSCF